jgi:cellulose biosynthesis protein BcsQ
MTSNTSSNVLKIFDSISPQSSESDVEKKIVTPLLRILGYSDQDWRTQVVIGNSKLDFVIHPPDAAIQYPVYLIIEVKAPSKKIAQSVWQINSYMRKSGAVLGLLTNGCQFRIFYNYQGKITTVADYNQATLTEQFNLFYKILGKKTCLVFSKKIYYSQEQVYFKFANLLTKVSRNKNLFEIFKKKRFHSNEAKQLETKINSSEQITISELSKADNTNNQRKAMIVTIFNNKGGVGKTTLTINLAAALSKTGKRVLLIDIDAQANLTMGLGIDPLEDVEHQGKKDISHLLTEPRTTLEDTVIRKRWNDIQLDIVPSHIRLSDMEATLIMTPDIDRVLVKKLKKYQEDYDYVLIDPPPSFGKANTIAMMASSGVLIPTQLSSYPIRALEYVVGRAIGFDQSKDEPMPILGIAVSMYNRSSGKVNLQMTEKLFELMSKIPDSKNVDLWPQNTWIPNLSIVSMTPNKGYPLCFAEFDDELNAREKEAAQDAFNCYMELAKHFVSVTQKKD